MRLTGNRRKTAPREERQGRPFQKGAQRLADTIRELRRTGGADAETLDLLVKNFRGALYCTGTGPWGGEAQREVERLVLDEGMTVDEALRKTGC